MQVEHTLDNVKCVLDMRISRIISMRHHDSNTYTVNHAANICKLC